MLCGPIYARGAPLHAAEGRPMETHCARVLEHGAAAAVSTAAMRYPTYVGVCLGTFFL